MICDLCKPLNLGESDTVRIIFSVEEAAALKRELINGLTGPATRALIAGLADAAGRHAEIQAMERSKP